MKTTGIVRKIDNLGRIVVPKEIRKVHGWTVGTTMEFYVTEEGMAFKPFVAQCAACRGSMKELVQVKNIHVCKDCLSEVKE